MKRTKRMFYPIDCIAIAAFSGFVLLDTFVIPRSYTNLSETEIITAVPANASQTETETIEDSGKETAAAEPEISDASYMDENISIVLNEYRYLDTDIYVADVTIAAPEYLYSAMANDTYGKNVTAPTSEIAEDASAILAINGDYYGARNKGYVLRNGVLFRTSAASSDQEDLVIHSDGSFEIIREGSTDAEQIDDAMQIYSFGPALVEDGELSVSLNDEVGRAKASNPRTAIAEIEPLHYLFVVSDGRSDESEGLSLYELAEFLRDLGAETAYNLDGGGSSTMIFNGALVNNPTTTGNKVRERSVSDAICIGYES